MPSKKFVYEIVQLVRVVDGDTIIVDVDLGFGVWARGLKLRLYGMQSPELDTDAGKAARTHIVDLISSERIEISTFKNRSNKDKDDGRTRYIAVVWIVGPTAIRKNVNERMILDGHAVRFMETETNATDF